MLNDIDQDNKLDKSDGPDQQRTRFLRYMIFPLVFLIVIVIVLFERSAIYRPQSAAGEEVVFNIAKGDSVSTVSYNLYKKQILRRTSTFQIYAYFTGKYKNIQPGQYVLSQRMSVAQIVNELSSSDPEKEQLVLRFKEGWTVGDTADYLDENEVVSKERFNQVLALEADNFHYFGEQPDLKSLEGYLFPDTYFFRKDVQPETIIETMIANTDKKIDSELRTELQIQKRTIYDVLTLASIIEKEVGRNTKSL